MFNSCDFFEFCAVTQGAALIFRFSAYDTKILHDLKPIILLDV